MTMIIPTWYVLFQRRSTVSTWALHRHCSTKHQSQSLARPSVRAWWHLRCACSFTPWPITPRQTSDWLIMPSQGLRRNSGFYFLGSRAEFHHGATLRAATRHRHGRAIQGNGALALLRAMSGSALRSLKCSCPWSIPGRKRGAHCKNSTRTGCPQEEGFSTLNHYPRLVSPVHIIVTVGSSFQRSGHLQDLHAINNPYVYALHLSCHRAQVAAQKEKLSKFTKDFIPMEQQFTVCFHRFLVHASSTWMKSLHMCRLTTNSTWIPKRLFTK